MNGDSRLEKLIIDLFDINALKFGDFKMKVGVNSPVYFDLRSIVSYPKLLDLLTTLITELIKKENMGNYSHICGVPYTALPLATLVSIKTETPMLIRRREAKDYGTRKMIEGHFKRGDECLIIEDVVTSGSSIIDTFRDLNNEGLKATHAVVVVDREQGGTQNLKEKGIKMHVLVTLSELLKILLRAGKISENVVEDVQKYTSNTQINIDGSFRVANSNGN
ncbi:UNVERIFIED_CONTAM: hypothetical protein PYX00_000390 [Menopon gallinae]|uniref:Uridine 5'-monophosphate synthase n=1 Tax=Menopon gallinae TaxID=328185 RepID=A0AAW2IA29_9NEOP